MLGSFFFSENEKPFYWACPGLISAIETVGLISPHTITLPWGSPQSWPWMTFSELSQYWLYLPSFAWDSSETDKEGKALAEGIIPSILRIQPIMGWLVLWVWLAPLIKEEAFLAAVGQILWCTGIFHQSCSLRLGKNSSGIWVLSIQCFCKSHLLP